MFEQLVFANALLSSSAAYILNFTLLYLIAFRTSRVMQTYGRILAVHCVSDLIYNTSKTFFDVRTAPIGGKLYSFPNGLFARVDSSTSTTWLVCCSFVWTIFFSTALLPIDFIWRYQLVCKCERLQDALASSNTVCFSNVHLKTRFIVLLIAIAFFVTAFHCFFDTKFFMFAGPSADMVAYTRELHFYRKDVRSYTVTTMASFE